MVDNNTCKFANLVCPFFQILLNKLPDAKYSFTEIGNNIFGTEENKKEQKLNNLAFPLFKTFHNIAIVFLQFSTNLLHKVTNYRPNFTRFRDLKEIFTFLSFGSIQVSFQEMTSYQKIRVSSQSIC